jgi:hypothetical protein
MLKCHIGIVGHTIPNSITYSDQFISYDKVESVNAKLAYLNSKDLAGGTEK